MVEMCANVRSIILVLKMGLYEKVVVPPENCVVEIDVLGRRRMEKNVMQTYLATSAFGKVISAMDETVLAKKT